MEISFPRLELDILGLAFLGDSLDVARLISQSDGESRLLEVAARVE